MTSIDCSVDERPQIKCTNLIISCSANVSFFILVFISRFLNRINTFPCFTVWREITCDK